MVLINTTFHVPLQLRNVLVTWLKEQYTESALKAGHKDVRILRVMGGGDDGISIAFQSGCPTLAEAKRWHDSQGIALQSQLMSVLGKERVAFFTTYLQVI